MSGAAAGVVTTSTGPCRAASAWTSGVVRTTSPRKAVWMTRARPGAAGTSGMRLCNLEAPTRPARKDDAVRPVRGEEVDHGLALPAHAQAHPGAVLQALERQGDRKSTRLNSSHGYISY